MPPKSQSRTKKRKTVPQKKKYIQSKARINIVPPVEVKRRSRRKTTKSKSKSKPRSRSRPRPPAQKRQTRRSSKRRQTSGRTKLYTRKPIKSLLDHQKIVVDHMRNYRGLIVYHGLGTGKTRTAIGVVSALNKPALVVVPAALTTNFENEIKKSNAKKSLFTIVSSRKFLTNPPECSNKILIVDEAHELRNAQGETSKAVKRCAYQADKILLLTGTPLVNGPWDIAPLLNMIIGEDALPEGQTSFSENFGTDGLQVPKVWEYILPCRWSVHLPPPSPEFPTVKPTEEIIVPMHSEQLRVYNAWENKQLTLSMIRTLTDKYKNISRFNSLFTQVPQFKAYLDGGRRLCNVVEVDGKRYAPKFEEALRIIEKTSGKCVVFSQFIKSGIEVMAKLLEENEISYSKFTGKETQTQKDEAVESYNKDKVKVFLFSGAGGQGLNLFNTEVAIIMEPHWNESKIVQAIGRVARYKSHTGENKVVTVYRLFCSKPESGRITSWFTDDSSPKRRKPHLKQSADMYLRELSKQKEQNNKKFLQNSLQYAIEVLECKLKEEEEEGEGEGKKKEKN